MISQYAFLLWFMIFKKTISGFGHLCQKFLPWNGTHYYCQFLHWHSWKSLSAKFLSSIIYTILYELDIRVLVKQKYMYIIWSRSGSTVIKLFEFENVLKCNNHLHHFKETLFLFSYSWQNSQRCFAMTFIDIINLILFFDIIENYIEKSLRIFSCFMTVGPDDITVRQNHDYVMSARDRS